MLCKQGILKLWTSRSLDPDECIFMRSNKRPIVTFFNGKASLSFGQYEIILPGDRGAQPTEITYIRLTMWCTAETWTCYLWVRGLLPYQLHYDLWGRCLLFVFAFCGISKKQSTRYRRPPPITDEDTKTDCCYVSRRWMHKFQTFTEPGPVDNRDFLCQHGGTWS